MGGDQDYPAGTGYDFHFYRDTMRKVWEGTEETCP